MILHMFGGWITLNFSVIPWKSYMRCYSPIMFQFAPHYLPSVPIICLHIFPGTCPPWWDHSSRAPHPREVPPGRGSVPTPLQHAFAAPPHRRLERGKKAIYLTCYVQYMLIHLLSLIYLFIILYIYVIIHSSIYLLIIFLSSTYLFIYVHLCMYLYDSVCFSNVKKMYLHLPMSPRSICKLFFQCIPEVCAALVLTKPFPIAHPTPCFDGVQPTEL